MTPPSGWVLVLDTATSTIVAAVGSREGEVLAQVAFEGRYRHSQELLPAVNRLLEQAGARLRDLGAVIVGTGPGAFTGLRVGLATAKTLAHELHVPVIGIATSAALLDAAGGAGRLWLPSGPRERLLIAAGSAPLLSHDRPSSEEADGDLAVDLAGRASEAAHERGRAAVAGLPESLLRLGLARLAAGESDDPERLVPAYAVPPRGAPATEAEGGVAWSRDPR
jgi:tRNA A37 threonylcarbamoyladenosine modification protein TsaB